MPQVEQFPDSRNPKKAATETLVVADKKRGRPRKETPDSTAVLKELAKQRKAILGNNSPDFPTQPRARKLEKVTKTPVVEIDSNPKEEAEKPIIGSKVKLFDNAPDMTKKDFLTPEGRYVDFTAAGSLPELVNIIREVGSITNNNGQQLEGDTVINLIYEYIYQPKPDWTKITLRHRLREAVYALIEKYKKTPEYLNNLGQVGLFNINSLHDLKAEIIKKSFWTLPNGLSVGNQTIISLIDNGLINDLPGPIREKVISLNKTSFATAKTEKKEGWGAKIKSLFTKKWF